MRIGDIVQDNYAQLVDVDKDMLFQMHIGADYLDIKPLLELTSLAVVIGYIWVSAFYVVPLAQTSWLERCRENMQHPLVT